MLLTQKEKISSRTALQCSLCFDKIKSENRHFFLKIHKKQEKLMSQEIELSYDSFLLQLAEKLKKIDVELAMKLMYLERKLTDVDPHVDLSIKIVKP